MRQAYAQAGKALTWWMHELAAIVPKALRDWIGDDEQQAIVRVDAQQARSHGHHGSPLTIEGHEIANLPLQLRRRIRNRKCILMLPLSSVLRQVLELPLAASKEIVAASSFLIERITPFTLNQVRYSCVIIGKDRVREVVKVQITVVPNSAVAVWIKQIEAQGISIRDFHVEGDRQALLLTAPAHGVYDFTTRNSWYREPSKLLMASSIALLTAGPMLILAQAHGRAEALQAKVLEEKGALQGSTALQVEVETLEARLFFLSKRMSGAYPIEIFAELTRLLPDDTWLFDIDFKLDEIRITGFSSTIPVLLEILHHARSFGAPELMGSIVHGSERDRFEIRLRTSQGSS